LTVALQIRIHLLDSVLIDINNRMRWACSER